jgi:hypothetical protein
MVASFLRIFDVSLVQCSQLIYKLLSSWYGFMALIKLMQSANYNILSVGQLRNRLSPLP